MSEGTPPPPPDPETPEGSTPPPPPPGGGYGTPPPPPPPGGSVPPPSVGGYQAAPPPPPPGPAGPRPGELLDRFLARLIDGVVLFVVGLIINSVLIAAFISSGSNGFGMYSSFGAYAIVTSIITAVLYLGYFALMESTQGKTVGKMVMKLHVEGPGGAKPTFEEAAKRNIWLAYPILGVIPFLGLVGAIAALVAVIMIAVQINSDPERKPWTDKFA